MSSIRPVQIWSFADDTARDATGSNDGLVFQDLCYVAGTGVLSRATSVGATSSTWAQISKMPPVTTQTINSTPVALFTQALADDSAVLVTARVTAVQVGGSERAGYIVNAVVFRDGGGATLQGTSSEAFRRESTAMWDADIVVSGNNFEVEVTGEEATNINWTADIEVGEVTG